MSGFQQAKIWLTQLLGLPKDAVHIYVGLTIFLLAAIVSRRSLGAKLPIGAALAAALLGEAWDIFDTHAAGQRIAWAGSWHDLWNTAFWPTMLFLLARFTRVLKR
jgi:hypothetical protein